MNSIKSSIVAALAKIELNLFFIVPLGCIDVSVYVPVKDGAARSRNLFAKLRFFIETTKYLPNFRKLSKEKYSPSAPWLRRVFLLGSSPCDSKSINTKKNPGKGELLGFLVSHAQWNVFYKAATFFSSFLMARLMKSLMVVPVDATIAATRE